jgi:hypothetical protein
LATGSIVPSKETTGGQTKQTDEEKAKSLRRVVGSKAEVEAERERQEVDSRVAAAHTYRDDTQDRVGHSRTADARLAKQDRKKAAKQAKGIAKGEKQRLQKLNVTAQQESKGLYAAAIKALEEASLVESDR